MAAMPFLLNLKVPLCEMLTAHRREKKNKKGKMSANFGSAALPKQLVIKWLRLSKASLLPQKYTPLNNHPYPPPTLRVLNMHQSESGVLAIRADTCGSLLDRLQ